MSTQTIKLIPIEAIREKKETKRVSKRFADLNRLLSKFVTYYQDEELRKTGSPFIWTE